MLGKRALALRDLATARRYCDDAVTIYRDLDDQWQLAGQLGTRATVAEAAGDVLSVSLDVAEAAAISLQIGEERGLSFAVCALGHYADMVDRSDVSQQLAAAYYAFLSRLGQDNLPESRPLVRPDDAAMILAPSLADACRTAIAELFG